MRHNPIRRLPTHHEPASAPALPTLPWMAAEVVVVRRPVRDRVLDARCDSVDPFGGLLDGLDRSLLRPGGGVGDRLAAGVEPERAADGVGDGLGEQLLLGVAQVRVVLGGLARTSACASSCTSVRTWPLIEGRSSTTIALVLST